MHKHADMLRDQRGLRRCGWYIAISFPASALLGECLRPGWWPAFVPLVVLAAALLAITELRWRRMRAYLRTVKPLRESRISAC
jgi:hypothetical protein